MTLEEVMVAIGEAVAMELDAVNRVEYQQTRSFQIVLESGRRFVVMISEID